MLRELVLELEDGRKARIRFTETAEVTTSTPCDGSGGCEHEVTPERAALIFRAIDVDYDGDALRSAQTVMMQNKAEQLFKALHTSPGFLDNPQFQICPPAWDDQSTRELLELYLTGFTPQMLALHFQVGIRAIVSTPVLRGVGGGALNPGPHQVPPPTALAPRRSVVCGLPDADRTNPDRDLHPDGQRRPRYCLQALRSTPRPHPPSST